jgi:hypothetical protein
MSEKPDFPYGKSIVKYKYQNVADYAFHGLPGDKARWLDQLSDSYNFGNDRIIKYYLSPDNELDRVVAKKMEMNPNEDNEIYLDICW